MIKVHVVNWYRVISECFQSERKVALTKIFSIKPFTDQLFTLSGFIVLSAYQVIDMQLYRYKIINAYYYAVSYFV